jgi:hypothetical protein
MAVRIRWQHPFVLEERKRAQWERIIRSELGELDDPLEVSLRFEGESLRWKVEARLERPSGPAALAPTRDRVVSALRAAGKPAV